MGKGHCPLTRRTSITANITTGNRRLDENPKSDTGSFGHHKKAHYEEKSTARRAS
jgi:hypothetical protein